MQNPSAERIISDANTYTSEISGGFVLDTEKPRLYYDDPYGYEQQADQ